MGVLGGIRSADRIVLAQYGFQLWQDIVARQGAAAGVHEMRPEAGGVIQDRDRELEGDSQALIRRQAWVGEIVKRDHVSDPAAAGV